MSFTQQHLPNNIFMLTEETKLHLNIHFHQSGTLMLLRFSFSFYTQHSLNLYSVLFECDLLWICNVLFRLRTMYFMTGNLIWRRNDNNVRRETLKIKLVKETGNYEFTEYLSNSSLNSKYQLSFYVFKTVSLTFLAHWHMISVTEQPKVLQWLTRQ